MANAPTTMKSGPGIGVLESLSPADGSQLAADPEIARFTPITAVVRAVAGQVAMVSVKIGSLWWTVYDGANWMPLFAEHSSAAISGSTWTFSVIPNGGWWRSAFEVNFWTAYKIA